MTSVTTAATSDSSPKVPMIKPSQRPRPPGIKIHKSTSTSASKSSPPAVQTDDTQNLTQASIDVLRTSEVADEPVIQEEVSVIEETENGDGIFAGLSEEEIFRRVTRPDDIPGVKEWGIPNEADPELCKEGLKTKVSNFLRLKYERGQHINTTLLSSSSFANPHIYAKLVEFVQINETASAFPDGGWLTRQNLESLIPTYGPKALSAAQKTREDELRKTQEAGKRSNIAFVSGGSDKQDSAADRRDRPHGKDREEERSGVGRKRERERERDRDRGYEKEGGYRGRDSARDRQRERDHARERERARVAGGRGSASYNGTRDGVDNGGGSGSGRWSDRGR